MEVAASSPDSIGYEAEREGPTNYMHAIEWRRNPGDRNNVNSACPCLVFYSSVIPGFDPGTLFREWGLGTVCHGSECAGRCVARGLPRGAQPPASGAEK